MMQFHEDKRTKNVQIYESQVKTMHVPEPPRPPVQQPQMIELDPGTIPNPTNLIGCFEDTINRINTSQLLSRTNRAIQSTCVYKEEFQCMGTRPIPTPNGAWGFNPFGDTEKTKNIDVLNETSFAAAGRYVNIGKTAVLNFANPCEPGGGVTRGAKAQEECLCRSSNLYPCLISDHVWDDYYAYHAKTDNYFSDRIIYTDGVTVFKSDDPVPVLLPEEQWFCVDVITCAAPYLAHETQVNHAVLKEIFKKRIRNIFETALDHNVRVLILGAFGCGAFKNPPEVVAAAFREVIAESYQGMFDRIVFAIKSTTGSDTDPYALPCPNVMAFEQAFYGFSWELNHFGTDEPQYEDLEKSVHQIRWGIRSAKLYDWIITNPYYRKNFSILGDSISTLEGYNPKGYRVFFDNHQCREAGIRSVEDTWWDQVISYFGGELLVNNSWSGSRVTKMPGVSVLFPSGCSDERTNGLHIGSVLPDVILVYLGTNDWAYGARLPERKRKFDGMEYFDWAYAAMLDKLRGNYPHAEIWCCTCSMTYMSSDPDFRFPEYFSGQALEDYNKIIRKTAKRKKCKLIDLYANHMPYDSIDGSHPNADGMHTLALEVIQAMADRTGRELLEGK